MQKILTNIAIPLVMAAALVAAAPASAQRMSLADRVTLLEQKAGDNAAQLDLLRQVQQLTSEVQSLRAQVEELGHQQDQLKQTSRSQYLDLDGRLNRLDGGQGGGPVLGGGSTDQPSISVPDQTPAPSAAVSASDSTPSVYGDPGALAQTEGEQAAYDAAFNALKGGDYAESAQLFQSFLETYPSGTWAPNALYWLGESYYVTQNYELAQTQFKTLLTRYPTHDKAAGAMLKVGLSQQGRGLINEAEATLGEVISRYPGTTAASTAADRLQAMELGRLR